MRAADLIRVSLGHWSLDLRVVLFWFTFRRAGCIGHARFVHCGRHWACIFRLPRHCQRTSIKSPFDESVSKIYRKSEQHISKIRPTKVWSNEHRSKTNPTNIQRTLIEIDPDAIKNNSDENPTIIHRTPLHFQRTYFESQSYEHPTKT